MMQRIRWFFLILGIIVVVVLSLWNSGMVTVKIPFIADRELSLSMLLLVCSATSFVFGSVMTGWMLRGRRKAAVAKEKAKAIESTTSTDESVFDGAGVD